MTADTINDSANYDDKTIRLVQATTRALMGAFREKAHLLSQCKEDIDQLVRRGYDTKKAQDAARNLFGTDKVSFLAIDGTGSQDQALDMLIFYAGAFGYAGQLDFTDLRGCSYTEPFEVAETANLSAAIPLSSIKN